MNRTIVFSVSLCIASWAAAEAPPFSDPAWSFSAQEHRVEQFDGRETLFLRGGTASLPDVPFHNGSIEFEIMVGPEPGFSGAHWRIQDARNYEDFYIRPHQSGNPDANQYQPVFNAVSGWQIYFGPEYSVPVEYPFQQWIPIRIDVKDLRAQVLIGEQETRLIIDDLKHGDINGAIGLSSGAFAGARFAGFRYTLTDDIEIPPRPGEDDGKETATGLVTEWSVSDAVDEASISDSVHLPADILQGLEWHGLAVESNGIANLARIQSNRDGPNTAFARLVLHADEATIQPLQIGFSDRVRAYANGSLLYFGSDQWRSRDYRFLGTVGLHDTIYLPLRPGRNDILLAVSESFGGWAVSANLELVAGVTQE